MERARLGKQRPQGRHPGAPGAIGPVEPLAQYRLHPSY